MRKPDGILSGKFRKAILGDEHPSLIWPGDHPCPVEKGDEIGLIWQRSLAGPAAQVSITITAVKRGKKGEHLAEYSVRDDRPLWLRHNEGYTRSRSESVDPEADVTDGKTLDEFAATSRLRTVRRQREEESEEEARRKRERAIRDRLRETLRGLNAESQVALLSCLEREIQKAQMREVA